MLELAAVLALLIGVLLGMLGGGGSVLLVPVLLYVLKLAPKDALATSQLVMAATTLVAIGNVTVGSNSSLRLSADRARKWARV